MQGYVARKRDRYYAVIYEGLDPVTGRERGSWHPAGTDRGEAEKLTARLRPSFFAQNLATAYRDDIRRDDRLRLPAGRGRTSFIDARDIADVAALVLTDPAGHQGEAYTMTGPVALTYDQVASRLSAVLGRPIEYQPIGLWRYRRELQAQGLPKAYVNVQLLINVIARMGLAARVTETVAELLKRPPLTIDHYLADHRDTWPQPTTSHP